MLYRPRWPECLQWDTEDEVCVAVCACTIIELAIAHNLGLEPWQRQESHCGEILHGLPDFEPDLVFEEPWMSHHVMVEDIVIGERGGDEVKKMDANQRDDAERNKLAGHICPRPGGEVWHGRSYCLVFKCEKSFVEG